MTEHPNIADRDWRLHAITTLTSDFESPTTGVRHPAGTVVELASFLEMDGEALAVPAADAAAIYLSLAVKASVAGRRTRAILSQLPRPSEVRNNHVPVRRVSRAEEGDYLDSLQEIVASVVFSYTSIEAFANAAIPADFVHRRLRQDKRCTEEYDRSQIERHLSLADKLHDVLPSVLGIPSPKGTVLWERFVRLEKLRDRLVHLKRSDWRERDPKDASGSIWSALLAPEVTTVYKVAVDLAWHFSANDRPRWVIKAREIAEADAA